MRRPSRRQLLVKAGALGLLGGTGFVPARLLAAAPASGQRFLFVFCPGGWDQTYVFAPNFNNPEVDRTFPCRAEEINGIPFVDTDSRPSVKAFLENWGSQTCFVNGIQVPSIAHEVCRRILLTGQPQPGAACWPSIIAGHGAGDLAMPNVHIAGPLYPGPYQAASVRVGSAGQLYDLLSGEALSLAARPAQPLFANAEALQEAYLRRRLDAFAARDPQGRAGALAAAEQVARQRAAWMAEDLDAVDLGAGADFAARCKVALAVMENGWSRTAVLAYDEGQATLWDTHTTNALQDVHFEGLFAGLDALMGELATRPAPEGGRLLDHTTLVVLSEMGRMPVENGSSGKEHWTWTAALLAGAGIAGGRAVGGWTDDIEGQPTSLSTGGVDPAGVTLTSAHLGATLLQLAEVDPIGEGIEAPAIEACLA